MSWTSYRFSKLLLVQKYFIIHHEFMYAGSSMSISSFAKPACAVVNDHWVVVAPLHPCFQPERISFHLNQKLTKIFLYFWLSFKKTLESDWSKRLPNLILYIIFLSYIFLIQLLLEARVEIQKYFFCSNESFKILDLLTYRLIHFFQMDWQQQYK